MNFARTFVTIGLTAALAACSGNLGSGESTLPGTPGSYPSGSNVSQVAQAAPTPTPVSASNVATLAAHAPQPLPTIAGWAGTVAFAAPVASATPSAKASDSASAAPASIGITASVVQPTDAPPLGPALGRHAKRDPSAPVGLLYITLLATSDVAFAAYPRFVIDVPREIAAKHLNDTLALALYDSGSKDKAFHLGAAQRDPNASATDLALPSTPSPSPTPTAFPAQAVGSASLMPPPVGAGLGSNGLPAQPVAFTATATTLAFKENVPLVFALYAVAPSPSPSVSPSATASPTAAKSPIVAPSASPVASASPAPASSAR